MAGSIINPGSVLLVPVGFETGSREGPVSSSITVMLESTDTTHTRYSAQAELLSVINPDFTAAPMSLQFGGILPGESATQIVVFRPKALKELVIKQPEGLPKEMAISLIRNPLADLGTTLEITLHAPQISRHQRLDGIIKVPTSSKRVPVANIQFRGFVKQEAEIAPEVIVLPNRSGSGESRFTILTTQMSRITRIVKETPNGTEPIREIGVATATSEEWDLKHVKSLPNSMLIDSREIIFELEVQKSPDRRRATSVAVQIKSLNN